jgi:peptidoglycan/LPS O-acetylase OafA/YrhL
MTADKPNFNQRAIMRQSSTSSTDKLLGLEALRFVAAFAVLIWHYQHFAYVGDQPVDFIKSQTPFYGLLWPFFEAGEYGVWAFWCISGFIFFWKYRDAIANRSIGGWTFFIFRLSRLYPLHVATLLAVALLQPLYWRLNGFFFVYQNNDIAHFLPQLFLASDWGLVRSDSFNGPIWSISVEVLVYAIFFLSLRFATRSPLLNLVVVLVCVKFDIQVCSCLAFFYAGGLAAIGRRAVVRSRFRIAIEAIAWCAAAGLPGSIWLFSLQSAIVPWILMLGYVPILLFSLSGEFTLSTATQRLVQAAGNMTYSSYLLHFPIQLVIALGFSIARRPIPYHDDWFFAAFIGTTLLASYLTYRYFEAPAQALIRGSLLSGKGRPMAQAAG